MKIKMFDITFVTNPINQEMSMNQPKPTQCPCSQLNNNSKPLEFSVITSFWRHIIGGASLDFLEPANNVGFSTADSLARSLAQIGVKLGCMCFVRAPNGLNLTLAFQFRAV